MRPIVNARARSTRTRVFAGISIKGSAARRLAPALLLVAGACATNPATGERQISLVGEEQEIAMGREADAAISAQLGLYPDEALQQYVHRIGTRLAAVSERPHLPWTFRVVDDPTVNAFALPGGFIYVTRGIMAYLGSEAQLASVLGHEIGHVTARHSVEQMSRAQLAQIGLAVGTIIRPDLANVFDLAGSGLGLLFLKYGRDDERQSDDLGVRYMTRANYDPREAPLVFDLLDRVSQEEGAGRVPEWLSTHPDPGNRRDRLNEAIAAMQLDPTNLVVARPEYLQRIDGIVYGQNPREGFFRGTEFLHPDLRFRFDFPQGWQTVNQKQAVLAMSPQQDALMQITLAQGNSAQAAANAFLSQQGIQAGSARSGNVNGLRTISAPFAANTESGVVQGRVAWIEYNSNVYQVLGYGTQQRWPANEATVERSIQTFDRLTESAALNAQPLRLDIVTASQAMSFDQFARQNAGPIDVQKLALLNQASAGARVSAGDLVKRVVGQKSW
jgi:predicted Zn-dependent protease